MPTVSQIKQYLTLSVIPVLAGAAANWLVVHLHFLASFHVTASSAAGALTQLGVFGVSAALAFLASHHILKGTYGTVLCGTPIMGELHMHSGTPVAPAAAPLAAVPEPPAPVA